MSPVLTPSQPLRPATTNRWWIVAASFCALLLGPGTMTFAFSVLLNPITKDLGVSRGTFSSGMMLFALLGSLSCPLLGKALDRWGSRRVLLPLILGFAAAVAALSRLTASPAVIFSLCALAGLLCVGLTPVAYARSVSLNFDLHRGLALGLAIAGVGCGVALVPTLMGRVVEIAGWRTAFLAYGALVATVAFIPVALFIKDQPTSRRQAALPETTGLEPRDIFTSWRFWAMLVAFFLAIVSVNGTVSHMVTLLVDRGVPVSNAVQTISVVGVAAIVSRVGCGWLLDRFSGPGVATLFLAVPIAGIALVNHGGTGQTSLFAALLLGLAIGAEVDILAYFVGRYFGLRYFGLVYGVLFAAFGVGSGIGPFVSGMAYDHFKTYHGVFVLYQILLAVACLLVLRLGAYRFGGDQHHAEAQSVTEQPSH